MKNILLLPLWQIRFLRRLGLAVYWLFVAVNPPANAADQDGIAFFEQKIRPLLIEHCYSCHSSEAEKLKGGLLLDSQAGWQRGGDSGEPIIVPTKPEESLLIENVKHQGGYAMPPDYQLPDAAIADLVRWIEMGAPDPRTQSQVEATRADKSWWSLQPIHAVEPPFVASPAWNESPIDCFIFAELSTHDLAPNPPAEPRALIRRMSYDVIGLPPTFEQVKAFEKAYAADARRAVEALADELLASPQYGEQWGRHWLDVVRFGESNGFERNVITDDIWPFRDYVIRSLNEDKPFNRFIVEHLAGDVVGKDDPEIEIGTAFLVAGPYDDVGNQDVVAQANIRAATLDDVITATSSAFLGLTINCARCHHHKFDPIPTEDYYRLRSAFEGVQHGRRVVATKEDRIQFAAVTEPLIQQRQKIESEMKGISSAIDDRVSETLKQKIYARPKIDPQRTEETFGPVEATQLRFVMHASTDKPNSAAGSKLVEFEVWSAEASPRNVAPSENGTVATGARSAVAEDFPEAYGPQFAIDGQFTEQWFIGNPAVLTLTFATKEKINRIVFSNSRGVDLQAQKIQGSTPCEYDVQVSSDGEHWTTVASSADREPWSPAHAMESMRGVETTAEEKAQLATLRKELAQIQAKLAAVAPLKQIWVGNYTTPKEVTRVHKGGDPMSPLDVVPPASLAVLGTQLPSYELPADAAESQRRLSLANWIASDDNPLTARVLANRVWHYHFGNGIVDTPSDFGFLGGTPTHPELLDWLAARLIVHDWKLKPLHREILLSQTYQQSAAYRDDGGSADKDSRWLWRFPPRRLTAEEVRDTMLAVSGQLDSRMGGPGFRLYKFTQNNVCTYFPLDHHGPETYRRAVYHQNARASVVDLLSDFDLPDIAFAAPRRAATTSPLQALTLLNHSFTLDMADALAQRSGDHAVNQSVLSFIASTYGIALQREPSSVEREAALTFIEKYGRKAFCRAMLNVNELMFLE